MSRKGEAARPQAVDDAATIELDGYIRQAELLKLVPVNRGTIQRWEDKGLFPKRRRLGPSLIAWPRSAVKAWQDAQFGNGKQPRP